MNSPDYKKIFIDIIDRKFPEKKEIRKRLESKNIMSALDVLAINEIIFAESDIQDKSDNQKYRSYKVSDILKILDYQKKGKLTNTQLSVHFKISRNSIAKWKKIYL